jgi:hypothetical protein
MSVEVQNRLNVPSRQATGDKNLALSLIFGLTENHGGFSVWPIHHSAVGWPPVRCTASYVFVQVPRSANRPFDSGFKENEINKNVPQSLSGWPGVSGSGSGWSRHTAKTED